LLAREIYPLAAPDSHLRLFGQETWNVWELRDRLGIVSHDLQQRYASDALGVNVILSGYYSSIDTWGHQSFTQPQRQRADQIADQLGVAHLKHKPLGSMSTGEQRRFLLGRALANDPGTLLLDEPTSGLDLAACFQYLDLIRSLIRAGKTLILVTHHIHEIPPEVSHVVLLDRGRILAEGDKASVLTSDNLSRLYRVPLQLVAANGFYQALPTDD